MLSHYIEILESKNEWIENLINTLSIEEKIAQLLILPVWTDKGEAHLTEIEQTLAQHEVGGILFVTGTPHKQVEVTNRLQQKAQIPFLVALDAEWGLAMRLKNSIKYPYQLALGGMPDAQGIYAMAAEIAKQLKRIGVHLNFSPCADVNTLPQNPVISYRSFGENAHVVSNYSAIYMKALHDNGIVAVAKHFPGHGATDKDSHYTLPDVFLNKEQFEATDLYPFKELINQGLVSIMTAHIYVPALDNSAKQASSISTKIVSDLLKHELNFKGLIITDAMDMKGVSECYPAGEADFRALLAGNDMLEMVHDVNLCIQTVKQKIETKQFDLIQLDSKLRKVLALKYLLGLNQKPKLIETYNLDEDLNTSHALEVNYFLRKRIVCMLRNENGNLPINKQLKTVVVSLSSDKITKFQETIAAETTASLLFLSPKANENEINELKKQIATFQQKIIAVHNLSVFYTDKFGLTPQLESLLSYFINSENCTIVLFANPYILEYIPNIEKSKALLISMEGLRTPSEEENYFSQEIVAQIVLGHEKAVAKLPFKSSVF